jgi:hypothetical protein
MPDRRRLLLDLPLALLLGLSGVAEAATRPHAVAHTTDSSEGLAVLTLAGIVLFFIALFLPSEPLRRLRRWRSRRRRKRRFKRQRPGPPHNP